MIMLSVQRPTSQRLETMTVQELVNAFLTDTGWASLYRAQIMKRMIKASTSDFFLWVCGNDVKRTFAPEPKLILEDGWPDIQTAWDKFDGEGSVRPFATMLLSSDWDYEDLPPRKGAPRMTTSATRVAGFLKSCEQKDRDFESLSSGKGGERALFNTIVNAYDRVRKRNLRLK